MMDCLILKMGHKLMMVVLVTLMIVVEMMTLKVTMMSTVI